MSDPHRIIILVQLNKKAIHIHTDKMILRFTGDVLDLRFNAVMIVIYYLKIKINFCHYIYYLNLFILSILSASFMWILKWFRQVKFNNANN